MKSIVFTFIAASVLSGIGICNGQNSNYALKFCENLIPNGYYDFSINRNNINKIISGECDLMSIQDSIGNNYQILSYTLTISPILNGFEKVDLEWYIYGENVIENKITSKTKERLKQCKRGELIAVSEVKLLLTDNTEHLSNYYFEIID